MRKAAVQRSPSQSCTVASMSRSSSSSSRASAGYGPPSLLPQLRRPTQQTPSPSACPHGMATPAGSSSTRAFPTQAARMQLPLTSAGTHLVIAGTQLVIAGRQLVTAGIRGIVGMTQTSAPAVAAGLIAAGS